MAAAALLATRQLPAQEATGSAWGAMAGAGLGLVTGTTLGAVGAVVPCSLTYDGPRCVQGVVMAAALLGATAGLALGAADEHAAVSALGRAGIGFALGAAAGGALTPFVQQWGWVDVLALGAVGSAIGASPVGAGLGVAAGTLTGVLLWKTVPGAGPAEVLGAGLAGMCVGGLVGWIAQSARASSSSPMIIARLSF